MPWIHTPDSVRALCEELRVGGEPWERCDLGGGESRRVWNGGKIRRSREAESRELAAGAPFLAGGGGLRRWLLLGYFLDG